MADGSALVALLVATGAFVLGLVTAYLGRSRGDQPLPPRAPGIVQFPGEPPERDERISNVVSLLTSQDLVTWAAMSISVTVQGVLVGFAASKDTSPVSLAWIAAVGIVAASFFMALIARSNGYMVHYIALLRGTNREEFQRLPNLPPPSARQLAHGIHVVFIVAWFIVALIAFGVLHL